MGKEIHIHYFGEISIGLQIDFNCLPKLSTYMYVVNTKQRCTCVDYTYNKVIF